MRASTLVALVGRVTLLGLLTACGGPEPGKGDGAPAAATTPSATTPQSGTATQPAAATQAADAAAPARLPADVAPQHYALQLRVDPAQPTFSGEVSIDVTLAQPTSRIWLHGQNLTVSSALIDAGGKTTEAQWRVADAEDGTASLVTADPLPVGPATIRVSYSAPFDATLEGLYRVDVGTDHYAFTQFEPLAARKAFPCFDEPRFKTPFDLTLVAPAADGAFANARETEVSTDAQGLTTHHFATTAALPTYLVAWVVGPLDVVEGSIPPSAIRSAPLPFRGLAPRGRGPELAYTMEHTPGIIAALEAWFDTPYPFDKLDLVAVPDFAAGAMENAGLVTYRDELLLLGAGAPASQRRDFAFTVAHELAHQWFGNLVTMAWWDDLWLNEGFATWMETTIVETTFPELRAGTTQLVTELEAFGADSLASARQIRQPIASQHDITNAFDAITYSKGASVIMTLQRWLGPEVFRRGIHRYLHEHARGSATTADLVAALSAESGRDVRPVMDDLTLRPGLPLLETTLRCDAGAAPRVDFAQSRYLPLGSSASAEGFWHVPVCVRWAAGGGAPQTSCTLLESVHAGLELPGTTCPDWVLPNADGGSYLRFTLAEDQLVALRRVLAPAAAAGGGAAATSPLSVRDQLALADSVRAGFRAGRIPFADALEVLAPLADSPEQYVAGSPMELLAQARDYYLTAAEKPAFLSYARELYAGQLRRLGWSGPPDEDPELRLQRAAVLGFLARVAEDPEVRREARARGEAYIAGGQIHPEAVAADYAPIALGVTAQEGGAPVFEQLAAQLTTTADTEVRGQLLGAIAGIRDPELRPRVLALALDERLRVNETSRPLRGQLADPDGREAAWRWLQEHYDALRARLGAEGAGNLPLEASGFCSAERAAELHAFFEPRMADTSGGPRNLASAIETVQLCTALSATQAQGARAFFAARAAGQGSAQKAP